MIYVYTIVYYCILFIPDICVYYWIVQYIFCTREEELNF